MSGPSLIVQTLLAELKLHGDSTPLQSQWLRFQAELKERVGRLETELDQTQKMLELAQGEFGELFEAVAQRELIIKAILDSSSDIIITLNSSGQIVEFNHRAEKTFGKKHSEVRGSSILELVRDGSFADELRSVLGSQPSLVESPNTQKARHTLLRGDGTAFEAEICWAHVNTEKNRMFPIYIRDLTEEIQAKQELEISRSQAAQAAKMASLGEMAGGIAHEINTPLSIFTFCSDLLRDAVVDGTIDSNIVLEAAETIEKTAYHISKIIVGLRNFSRDSGKDPMVPVSCRSVVEETVILCEQKLRSHDIKLTIGQIPENWFVLGRLVALTQVLLNLINNASDAIEGRPQKWIRIECERRQDRFVFSVIDSGEGIPPEVEQKLMQPFFTTKGVGKGTGLGLSISKGIVEAHRGELRYNGASPNTCFEITLPCHDEGVFAVRPSA